MRVYHWGTGSAGRIGGRGVYSSYYFAFIVPIPFPDANVCSGHPESLFGTDASPRAGDLDLGVHVFKGKAWDEGGYFCLSVGCEGEEGGGSAGEVSESPAVFRTVRSRVLI